jgi:hypothetical protein
MSAKILLSLLCCSLVIGSCFSNPCDENRLRVRQSAVDHLARFGQLRDFILAHRQTIIDSGREQLREQQQWNAGEPLGVTAGLWLNPGRLQQWLPAATADEKALLEGLGTELRSGGSIFYDTGSGACQFELPSASCGDTVFSHTLVFRQDAAGATDPARRLSRDLGGGWMYVINSYLDNEAVQPAPRR